MTSPIKNQVGTVFIPVSHIENARDWYCNILGLSNEGEILFGHLYIVPTEGTAGVVLDSKIYSPDNVLRVPVVQFRTDNIEQSYEYMKLNQVELITGIEHGRWFNFKDPDGNVLMVCQ